MAEQAYRLASERCIGAGLRALVRPENRHLRWRPSRHWRTQKVNFCVQTLLAIKLSTRAPL
jgi:hypothetical protein